MQRTELSRSWTVYGYGRGIMREDVGFEEEEVSMCSSWVSAMERDGEA